MISIVVILIVLIVKIAVLIIHANNKKILSWKWVGSGIFRNGGGGGGHPKGGGGYFWKGGGGLTPLWTMCHMHIIGWIVFSIKIQINMDKVSYIV